MDREKMKRRGYRLDVIREGDVERKPSTSERDGD